MFYTSRYKKESIKKVKIGYLGVRNKKICIFNKLSRSVEQFQLY